MSKLTAYRLAEYGKIVTGSPNRNWMDLTNSKVAYGCLPLVIANELGWDILCATNFRAIWNGRFSPDSIQIEFKDDVPENHQVVSHFGMGILTFHPGFLFKTEHGTNLLINGTPNIVKDGIQALDAVVETDWLPMTFTMNWKFTRENIWIEFHKGDPICRIMPYKRDFIETHEPEILDIRSDEGVHGEFIKWSEDRAKHNESLKQPNPPKAMEKDYFKGVLKDGSKIEYHQRKIDLKSFDEKK
ncbi:DUF6065 family protein [Pedobacter sp. JY14-1]|uniref:DUF6065 family protein n=1 Tax=Pedobacter sp. JY14-1 TaxID=3034151 RepID=UPI0023E28B43|nr:DUF6065 family protein [Pedobacter sp. JY14-1]